jgi:hypothetical protein
MIKYNGTILKVNNGTSTISYTEPVYNVTILSSEHGTVTAEPVSGHNGTTVTLSNTPDSGYHFGNYNISGANLYDGNKFDFYKSNVSVNGTFIANGLTIDLNNQGTECTQEFLTQTNYPGVWTGYRVFRHGPPSSTNSTTYSYIRNIGNLSSNFVMYYFFAVHNSSSYSWGKATYKSDNSACISQTTGWLAAGYDSQKPQYDKAGRYRNVTVNVSKGGDIEWALYYKNDPWYGNSIYFAIPEELVQDVTNSK